MEMKKRQEIAEGLFQECRQMAIDKGLDYAGTVDSLANFKRNAERLGISPFQVWLVYTGKHFDSICNAIKENPQYPETHSEPLHGRIIDIIVYLTILKALLEDLNPKKPIGIDSAMPVETSYDRDFIKPKGVETSYDFCTDTCGGCVCQYDEEIYDYCKDEYNGIKYKKEKYRIFILVDSNNEKIDVFSEYTDLNALEKAITYATENNCSIIVKEIINLKQ